MNILYLLVILALIEGAVAIIAVIKLNAAQSRTTSTAAHTQVFYERYFDDIFERIKTLEKKTAELAGDPIQDEIEPAQQQRND